MIDKQIKDRVINIILNPNNKRRSNAGRKKNTLHSDEIELVPNFWCLLPK